MKSLKKKLGGRSIDILFIDGGHFYADIKRDFEDYGPLCNGIIAIHDIEQKAHMKCDVKFYWHELKELSQRSKSKYGNAMFISFHQHRYQTWERSVGIGMIIKR